MEELQPINKNITPVHNDIVIAIRNATKALENNYLTPRKYRYQILEVDFLKRKKSTIGVYLITVHHVHPDKSFQIIAKGIRHDNDNNYPHEAQVLLDPIFNACNNPLNPPLVYHVANHEKSTWIYMEHISEVKSFSSWNGNDIDRLAIAIGRFNGQFSGNKILRLRWINRQNLKHIAANAFNPGIQLLKALHSAGAAGYTVAHRAAKSLEAFINKFPILIQWLSEQPIVLCHNDPGPDENIFIQSKNNRLRAIDWQNCGLSPIGFDPAWVLWKLQKAGEEYSPFCEKRFINKYNQGLQLSGISIRPSELNLLVAICYALIIIKRHVFTLQWEYTVSEGQPRYSFTYTFHQSVVFPLNDMNKIETATENLITKLNVINSF